MKKKPQKKRVRKLRPLELLSMEVQGLRDNAVSLESRLDVLESRVDRATEERSSWDTASHQHEKREAEKHAAHLHFLRTRADLYATLKAQIQADRPVGQGR